MLALLRSPLAEAQGLGLGERALRDALAVVVASLRVPRRVQAPHADRVKRDLGDGYKLDDDPARIDRTPCTPTSAECRTGQRVARARRRTRSSTGRAGGRPLLRRGQVGYSRALSDGHVQSYLADVYVLEEHRGRGLGVELVRFSVDEGPLASTKWYLHTADAHDLYRKFGFSEPGERRSSAGVVRPAQRRRVRAARPLAPSVRRT